MVILSDHTQHSAAVIRNISIFCIRHLGKHTSRAYSNQYGSGQSMYQYISTLVIKIFSNFSDVIQFCISSPTFGLHVLFHSHVFIKVNATCSHIVECKYLDATNGNSHVGVFCCICTRSWNNSYCNNV